MIAGAALSVAAPAPNGSKGPKGPPGPPSGTVYGVSQSCSASQSSISCCNTRNNGGKKKNVYYPDGSAELTCSQIDGKLLYFDVPLRSLKSTLTRGFHVVVGKGHENKPVQEICSTTVACCIGDGCVAIAN